MRLVPATSRIVCADLTFLQITLPPIPNNIRPDTTDFFCFSVAIETKSTNAIKYSPGITLGDRVHEHIK